uniref:DNA mismatch repair protein MutS n=1 Tax=Lygus hesperus TaxID=30085 RepID=A0A0A9YEP6_LYGHE
MKEQPTVSNKLVPGAVAQEQEAQKTQGKKVGAATSVPEMGRRKANGRLETGGVATTAAAMKVAGMQTRTPVADESVQPENARMQPTSVAATKKFETQSHQELTPGSGAEVRKVKEKMVESQVSGAHTE